MAKISDARHELLSLTGTDKFLVDDGENKKIKTENVKETLGINALSQALNEHKEDATNPHEVTKADLGLGNVDNTSDANKPLSDAQKNAIVTNFSGGIEKFASAEETKILNDRSLVDIDGQAHIVTRTSKNGHIIKTVSLYVEAL